MDEKIFKTRIVKTKGIFMVLAISLIVLSISAVALYYYLQILTFYTEFTNIDFTGGNNDYPYPEPGTLPVIVSIESPSFYSTRHSELYSAYELINNYRTANHPNRNDFLLDLRLAYAYFGFGDYHNAYIMYGEADKLAKSGKIYNFDDIQNYGRLLLVKGEFADLSKFIDKRLDSSPSRDGVRHQLQAAMYFKQGNLWESLVEYLQYKSSYDYYWLTRFD